MVNKCSCSQPHGWNVGTLNKISKKYLCIITKEPWHMSEGWISSYSYDRSWSNCKLSTSNCGNKQWPTKSIISKQPVDNEKQDNNASTWLVCQTWFVHSGHELTLSWRVLVQMEERILVHSSSKIKMYCRKEELQNKWYCFDSNRCWTKQLAYGTNFPNHQRWKQCISKCEIVDQRENVKFHFTYLRATNT